MLGLRHGHMCEAWFKFIAWIIRYRVFLLAYIGHRGFETALAAGFVTIIGLRLGWMRLIDVESRKRRILDRGARRRPPLIPRRMRRRSDHRSLRIVGFVHLGTENILFVEVRKHPPTSTSIGPAGGCECASFVRKECDNAG